MTAYRKSETRDPGRLQVGPRYPVPQIIQVGPGTQDPLSGTRDPGP